MCVIIIKILPLDTATNNVKTCKSQSQTRKQIIPHQPFLEPNLLVPSNVHHMEYLRCKPFGHYVRHRRRLDDHLNLCQKMSNVTVSQTDEIKLNETMAECFNDEKAAIQEFEETISDLPHKKKDFEIKELYRVSSI